MATYYIDETTPAQDSRSMANINAGMDSMLQSLDRMEASRQRSRYYDYMHDVSKEKAGTEKRQARLAAITQRRANRINIPLHKEYRRFVNKHREGVGKSLKILDGTLGKKLIEDGLMSSNMQAVDRIKAYKDWLSEPENKTEYEEGATGAYNRYVDEYYNVVNQKRELDKYEKALATIPGSYSFTNENGTTDYKYDDSNHLEEYYKLVYGEDPFTRAPAAKPKMSSGDYSRARKDIDAYSRKVGAEDITSPEYITPLGPESAQTEPRLMKMDRPDPSAAAPVPPQPTIFTDSVVADVEPEEAPPDLSEFAVRPEPAIFSKEWEENYERERNHRYYRNKLDETEAEIARVTRDLDGFTIRSGRAGMGDASRRKALARSLKDAVEDREKYKGLVEYTAPPRPDVFYQPIPVEDQPVPVEDQPVETLPPNPWTEDVTSTWMPDEIRNRKPAVEGNRPIRLDQLEGPVSGPVGSPITEEQARTPEYLQEGFRIPGNRGIANPYESVYQPWYDQKSDFEKAMYIDEQSRVPEGDSPLMDRVPPWERDSQQSASIPYKDPRFEAQLGFVDTGTEKYLPPFDRGPLVDRSFPEMGRVNDADYPASLEGDIVELKTMDGPVLMRRLNSPLLNREGRSPGMKEILWEDYPEVREPLDYEPYPGNPLYLPGGPLYEEEE